MDQQLTTDVRNAFAGEYFNNASKEMTGFSGWLMKTAVSVGEKMEKLEKSRSWKFPVYMATASTLPAFVFLGALVAAPLLTLAALGGAIWAGRRAYKEQDTIADKALDRDMENGTLPARYRAEILQPQIDALELKKSSLPAAGTAAAEFAKAVSPSQAVIETSPKPAPTAPNGPAA